MIKKISYLLVLIGFFFSQIRSEGISVVAGVDQYNNIKIRWFSNTVFNIEGVNIYRRPVNDINWIKLNNEPVKRGIEASKNDPDTLKRMYSALTYNVPKNPEDEGTWKLVILSKCIFDPEFASFYGMQFIDKTAESNKLYEYKVMRISNGTETEGSVSNQIKAEKYQPPAAPAGFKAKEGDGIVYLNWEHNKKKFFAYNIYRGDSPSGKKIPVNDLPVFIFNFKDKNNQNKTAEFPSTDTSVINGKTYYYELKGIDFLGRESSPSSVIKTTPKDLTPPPAAYNVKGIIKDGAVQIKWNSEKVKDLKEYNVLKGTEFKGPFVKLNKTGLRAGDSTFSDKISNAEPAYYYVVETVDFSGNFSKSFPSVVFVPDITPPSTPDDLKAIGDVGKVILSWKSNKEKDLAGYFIWRSMTGNEDDFLLLTTRPYSSNIYTDSLPKEVSNLIIYRIKAIDKSYNESQYSKTVNVKMKDVTPPARPFILSSKYDEGTFEISWAMNLEYDLAGYNIFMAKENERNRFVQINQMPVKGVTYKYKDSIISSGDYFFKVSAVDSSGNVSEKSEEVGCTVFIQEMNAFKADIISALIDADGKTVKLKWNSNTANTIIGYMVFRRGANEDNTEPISGLIQQTNYEDSIPNPENYLYHIRIYDNTGNVTIGKETKPIR